MVFDLKKLIQKYNMDVKNIIHIGGHHGQEIGLYKSVNPSCVVHIFEPHPNTFRIMSENVSRFSGIHCHNTALGPNKATMTMFVETANAGQSNSLLKPKLHASQYPHIRFNDTIEVEVNTLDSYELDESFNFISIDVQGFELEVLKGAAKTLEHVNYLIAEVNNAELYEGCCMVGQLDEYLASFGLHRVETDWEGGTWGDGFYIKK